MNITVRTGKIQNLHTNILCVFLFQETKKGEDWLREVDRVSGRRLAGILNTGDFKGELNETVLVYSSDKSSVKRILLVGMGKKREFNGEKARQVFGTAAKQAKSLKLKRFILCLTGISDGGLSPREISHYAAEGAVMSLYEFTKFKTEDTKKITPVTEIGLYDTERKNFDEYRSGAEEGLVFAKGTSYARDLASNPGNTVTPTYLAEDARKIAKENGFKCTVFDKAKLSKMGMNALLGVARGSSEPPYLIVLEYKCGVKDADTVALVGKGVTFDSGGISLKPSKKMEEMKYDMCGAAAVLGVMKILKEIPGKLKVNVIGIITTTENLPGGKALKPGDIITTYSGLTVEVINTDAEGRLILSDALAYAVDKYKPDAIVDLATLTGAIVVALGHYATGMFGNNALLLKKVSTAADKSGDMVWEMPLYQEYDEHIKSSVADIKNSNGPGAGATFGAAFLQKFVKKTPWVHLDIAGTAWDVNEKSYLPKGPTGVGVRLLARLLMDWK
ncbi:leucyl aminopeptidase [candidate division KSB1 bacterium]|nr:leucyl aminopeptidase [candidate division KSB1 bacterium]